jgi:hypothetical protein
VRTAQPDLHRLRGMAGPVTRAARAPRTAALREHPLVYEPPNSPINGSPTAAPDQATLTNTAGWTEEQVLRKIAQVKERLDWGNTTGSARKWWEAFEAENRHRLPLVLRLAEELAARQATVTEFFLAYVYSNTDNIQANLSYLDYTRLKKQEERKKREDRGKTGG